MKFKKIIITVRKLYHLKINLKDEIQPDIDVLKE